MYRRASRKPSIATRSSRCSRSYQRLNSASSAASMSIDVSSMPFPAIGIFKTPILLLMVRSASSPLLPRGGVGGGGVARRTPKQRFLTRDPPPPPPPRHARCAWREGSSRPHPEDEGIKLLARNLRRDVGDRPHHRVPDAGIIQRVAGPFDKTNFAIAPDRAKRMRGGGRTEQIVAALHDDAGKPIELCGFVKQLPGPHEAFVLEIMRFHERRGGQGTRRSQWMVVQTDR